MTHSIPVCCVFICPPPSPSLIGIFHSSFSYCVCSCMFPPFYHLFFFLFNLIPSLPSSPRPSPSTVPSLPSSHLSIHPQVEYSTDFSSMTEVADSSTMISDASAPHKLFVHIPMSVFKFYLHRILMASLCMRDDTVHSIMVFFQKTEVR